MIIVKTLDDQSMERYETFEQVYSNCEGIDVRDGLYEFSDEHGNMFDVEWMEHVQESRSILGMRSLTQGRYRLIKRD